MAEFAHRLFDGPLSWAKVRQGRKLIRLGQRYTPERLGDAIVSFGLPFHVRDLRIWGIPAHSDSVRAYPRSVQRMHALGPRVGCGQSKEDRVVKV